MPLADIDCGLSQATRVNERRVFGWVPVEASVLAACIPSSSSDRTAAERLMPPRLAHALIDTKREAGSRTVTSGSPPSAARALFVGFGALMILEITVSRTCVAIHNTRGGVITLAPGTQCETVICPLRVRSRPGRALSSYVRLVPSTDIHIRDHTRDVDGHDPVN